ncbi:hypothetical protein [Pseudarthrobacter sp. BIM B-2242]|uniref:hypothetical protein n=1 Tax=Pseudarthrobacter sp. BIM B-2242 TaxID=2772401 RepID=UPI00168C06E4|nr:hypothetical protein [Pseudarthrobacter sp. BIM B-2242]QOD06188.1 hypothetical protein IDT60_20375 [Pseudarthrobacter sp. BIM B-2242]
MPELVLAAADPCSPASRRGAAAGTVSRQDHPGHATGVGTSFGEILNRDVPEELPLGECVICDRDGNPVIVTLTSHDALVVARLQDVEDHPDLLPEDC